MEILLKTLGTLLFRAGQLVTGILIGVVTARLLGPEGKGVYAYATLVASIYLTFFGGLSAGAAREVSNLKKQPEASLANGYVLAAIFGCVAILVMLVLPPFLGRTSTVLLLVVVIAPASLCLCVTQGTFLGRGLVFEVNLASLFQNLVLLGGLILLVAFRVRTPLWAVVAWCSCQVFTAMWTYLRISRTWRPKLSLVDQESLKRLGRFVFQVGLVNVVSFLNYRVDAFLVESYLGVAQLGIYSVAISLSELLWQLSSAVSQVIYSRVGTGSREESIQLVGQTMRYLFAVVVVGALLMAVVGGWFLRLMYGRAFAAALPVVWLLLPGVVMYSMASVVSVFYTNQLGRPGIPLALASLSLVVCLVGSVLLIPRIGLAGGAVATSFSYMVSAAASLVITNRLTGLRIVNMLILNREDLSEVVQALARVRKRLAREPA